MSSGNKTSKKAALATCVACAALLSGNLQAATFSDTHIGYRYGTQFSEPNNPKDVTKNILSLGHVSGYSLGQNFFNLDVLQSDRADPSSGSGDNGATEAYLTYRHQFHYGKVFGEPLAFGPVKDMALSAGFDLNTKNTTFAPRKRQLVIGPTFKFDVPRGFVDLSLFYSREWNHCGLPPCGAPGNRNSILFDPYYQISLAWGLPFDLGAVPMTFKGFYNYNGKKGDDYFGVATKPEQLMRTALLVDVGKLAWGDANTLWGGVGYEYWRNKFGNHDKPGVDTDALTFNLEWHF